jgi:site-specific DNA-cytosine methylase
VLFAVLMLFGAATYISSTRHQAGFLKNSPFAEKHKYRVVGNGVPLAMGRAIAKAVRSATH